MNTLFFVFALSVSLFFSPTYGLDKSQLIGNRIPLIVEPQDQYLYSAAVDPVTGNCFLPWTKQNYRVYGRLFGPKGGKIAPLQSFIGGSIPGQPRWDGRSRIVFNPIDRQYLVVWPSVFGNPKYDPVAFEIRGQFVSSGGRAIGESWVITKESLFFRKLVHNSTDNQYALFYSFYPDKQKPPVLCLQRLDAEGQILGKARQLNSPRSDSTSAADIAYDPQRNQYLVVWGPDSIYLGLVRYRTVSADLKTLGTIHAVEAGPSTSANPVVVYDSHKKRFIIVWHNGGKLKMRGISTHGTPQTSVVSFNISNLISNYFTAAIHASSGAILIGYLVAPGGKTSLYLARIDNKFIRIGDPFLGSSQDARIHCGEIFLQYNPFAEEFMLIWSYVDRSPNSLDIYGQRVRGVPLTNAH